MLLSTMCFATEKINQGAVSSLCNNLNASCLAGNESDCQAFKSVTCTCNESGLCQRAQ